MEARIARFFQTEKTIAKQHLVREFILNLQGSCVIDSRIQFNSWLNEEGGPRIIVAKNGNISFDELDEDGRPKLLPHSSNYFTLVKLPYDYDPKAECPKWLEFLDEIMEGDEERIHLLQQWIGYLLTTTLSEQKFIICIGEGANGKGVFFIIVISMLGIENCSSVPLSHFGYRFSLFSTFGKLLNATSEGIGEITSRSEAVLKEYTAGDMMTFERKYQDPFSVVPTAKLMFATNEFPAFNDRSQGIWRRILLVPFEKTIPPEQQNKHLAEELKDEMSGIFNWAYDGMVDLEKNGFVKDISSNVPGIFILVLFKEFFNSFI